MKQIKRRLTAVLTLCMVSSLCACGAPKETAPDSYIENAQLTEEEESIVDLYDNKGAIFDYVVDDTAKSMYLETLQWTENGWEPVVSSVNGAYALDEPEGRLLLDFAYLNDGKGARVVLQGNGTLTAIEHSPLPLTEPVQVDLETDSNKSCATSTAHNANRTEIVYGTPILLVQQLESAQDTTISFGVRNFDEFAEPELGEYEHAYAVTVMFSQEPLS